MIEPILSGIGPRLKKVYESPFTGSIRAVLLKGIGMTWLPLSVVEDDIAAGRLLRLQGDEFSAALKIVMYRNKIARGSLIEDFWRHTDALSQASRADIGAARTMTSDAGVSPGFRQ